MDKYHKQGKLERLRKRNKQTREFKKYDPTMKELLSEAVLSPTVREPLKMHVVIAKPGEEPLIMYTTA